MDDENRRHFRIKASFFVVFSEAVPSIFAAKLHKKNQTRNQTNKESNSTTAPRFLFSLKIRIFAHSFWHVGNE